jgi:hypothetical protein
MKSRYLLCIRNDDYPASLETRKVYEVLEDAEAAKYGQVRIIDESGEDYLYPESYFLPFEVSRSMEEALRRAS